MSASPPLSGIQGNGRPMRPQRGAPQRLLDLFSSVWLGVSLLSILFVYCSIGSAAPRVRKHPWLEMTEFEWFHWWPFYLLITLICLNLIIVTVRRIPLRLVNLGVWTIHTGIITLAVGSVIYFSQKVEGDAPVFRRFVSINAPGAASPAGLLVRPGAETFLETPAGHYHFQIQSTNTDYTLLTGADQGRKAYAVNVSVTPPGGQTFVRQLLAGYPQYTEDVLPGQGRAVKILGQPLVDNDLTMSLEYEPTDGFFVMDSWALYTRSEGARQWSQRPIRGLPRHHEYIASRDAVFADQPLPLRPLDLAVRSHAEADADPMSDVSIHVTGFLPYAVADQRWFDGGAQLNPRLVVNVHSSAAGAADTRPQTVDMLALLPQRRFAFDRFMEFRWLDDVSQVDGLPQASEAMLRVVVPDAGLSDEFPVTDDRRVGREGPFTELAGTPFKYRIIDVINDFVLGDGAAASIAIVEIDDGQRVWTRFVSDRPGGSKDTAGGAADGHGAGGFAEPDPRIEFSYSPPSAALIFAALPDGRLFVVWNGQTTRFRRFVKLGEMLPIAPMVSVQPAQLMMRARSVVKPYVVPEERRQADAGEYYAMVQCDITTAGVTQQQWLRFCPYVFTNDQYEYPQRFPFEPVPIQLADGRRMELVFSRQRQPLPAPIALEDFSLISQIGGYTGSNITVRNWESRLRFWDGRAWTDDLHPISVNAPTQYAGFSYFQSAWDPPPREDLSGGMNYTVLGIGNRRGVNTMLAGCCISVVGMIFAFYVKPVIKRRRAAQSRARISSIGAGPVNVERAEPAETAEPAPFAAAS